MNASEFQTRLVRKLACTVDVISGREFTDIAGKADRGAACANCGGCSRDFGDMGLAAEGVALVNQQDGLSLRWDCPGCGRETWEATTILRSMQAAAETLADPLCYSCRGAAK
jgi:hypothetical protein